MISVTCIICFI